MPRHSGRRGKIKAQVGGLQTILGESLTADAGNQTYSSLNALWARSEVGYPCVKPDGLLSGGSVNPTANNDEVSVEAGSVQIGGATVAFSGTTVGSLTRPAGGGNVVITSIHVNGSGTVATTAGTEGAPGGARGAAGGPPFVPVDVVQIATVTLSDTAAAVVATDEIDLTAAERAAIPGYKIDYHDGQVVFNSPLEAIHTGTTAKKVYADYKFIQLVEVGDLFDWSLDLSTAQIETTAFNDLWVENVPGAKSWSGSFNGYFVNSYWYDQAAAEDSYWYLELYDDGNSSNRFSGFANIDWSVSVARDAAVTEAMTFTGNGELKRQGSTLAC